MNTTETSVHVSYEIQIGETLHRFEGTSEAAWARVGELMQDAPEGIVPHVRKIEVPTTAPAIVAPAPAIAAPTTHGDAIRRGVSAPDAARSTADLLAAQAAGFAPARPLYDRGTPVIALGVANARASHREWEAQPRLSEAVEAFVETIKREDRRDVMIPIRQLAMRADGSLVGANNERWCVETDALPQLANRLGVPAPGYLREVWPQLRALNWNHLLATAAGLDKATCPPDHAMRQTLQGDQLVRARLRACDGGTAMWAALSDSYAPFDVDAIAHSLARGLAKYADARCEITYDGRSAQFDVLFHSDVEPSRYVAGEFFKAGYRVKTSDVGGGSVNVSLLLYQNLCLNLICIDVAAFTLARLRHIGSSEALAERFLAAVRDGEQRLGHFLKAWGHATEEVVSSDSEAVRLLDNVADVGNLTEAEVLLGVFAGLKKTDQLAITGDDFPGLLAAHALDNSGARQLASVTRASVVNAITRYAHETVGRFNPGKQSELESQAGALIVGGRGNGRPAPLPLLLPKRDARLSL